MSNTLGTTCGKRVQTFGIKCAQVLAFSHAWNWLQKLGAQIGSFHTCLHNCCAQFFTQSFVFFTPVISQFSTFSTAPIITRTMYINKEL